MRKRTFQIVVSTLGLMNLHGNVVSAQGVNSFGSTCNNCQYQGTGSNAYLTCWCQCADWDVTNLGQITTMSLNEVLACTEQGNGIMNCNGNLLCDTGEIDCNTYGQCPGSSYRAPGSKPRESKKK